MRDLTALQAVAAERRIIYGSDPSQFFDVLTTSKARATAVFIHGGFWRVNHDLGHASFLCAALAKDGLNVANLEYRRVGNPGGGWPGTFDDILAGCEAVRRELGGDSFLVCGHSAGGQLALRAAQEDANVTGVIALAPVAVLEMAYELHLSNDATAKFLGGTPEQLPDAYRAACPSRHSLRQPAAIIHGMDDETVPITIARKFMERRKQDGVRLVELPGTGHMELIDPQEEAFKAVRFALRAMA